MKINLVSNEKFSVTKPNKGEVFVPDRETDSTLAVVEDIAAAFSSADTYEVGEYVSYDGGLYKCVSAVSASGEWDPDYWTAFTVMNEANSSEQLQADWDQTDDSSPDFIKNKPTIHTDRIVSPSGNLEVLANDNGTATISTSGLGNATAFFPAGFSIWYYDDTYSTDFATAIEFVGPYSNEYGTFWVPSDIENPESFNPNDYSTWCLYGFEGATSPYVLMFKTAASYTIVSGWESSTQSLELAYGETSGGFPTMNRDMVSVPKIIATVDQLGDMVPPAYDNDPVIAGTASAGSADEYARGDHVHPAETKVVTGGWSEDPFPIVFDLHGEHVIVNDFSELGVMGESQSTVTYDTLGIFDINSAGIITPWVQAENLSFRGYPVEDICSASYTSDGTRLTSLEIYVVPKMKITVRGVEVVAKSDYDDHVNNTVIHIASAERNYWNNKANSSELRYSFHPVTASFSGTSASADVMDRSINSFEIASGVDNLSITIPALAYNGKARDFICNINVVDEAGPENVVFGTNQTIDLGSDVLTGMEQGQNVLLFTEISQDHWMISRYGSDGRDKANAASLAAPYESDHYSAYVVGDYVTHEGTLYKCKSDTLSPPGEWDDNNWDAVTVTDEKVSKSGDTMTGTLTVTDGAGDQTNVAAGSVRVVTQYAQTAYSTGAIVNTANGKTRILPDNNGTMALQEGIAPAFSSSSTYDVGDYVTREGLLYKCATAVSTAGAWNAADWTEVSAMGEMPAPGAPNHKIWAATATYTTSGSTSRYVVTPFGGDFALEEGCVVVFKVPAVNSGTTTELNVAGTGNKTLCRFTAQGWQTVPTNAVHSGAIVVAQYTLGSSYSGTNKWVLLGWENAPLASPEFTGTPKAPTAAAGTNTTQIATTEFVQTAIGDINSVLDAINGEEI